MTILVTGSTGLLGNNIVRALLDQGKQVRVLIRTESDPRPLQGLDVETVVGDVRDPDSVQRAMQGVDLAIHSAAWVHIGWSGAELAQSINVEGTRNVAAAALAAGVRLVHVSSVDALGVATGGEPANEDTPVGGKPLCPYVVTKTEGEKIVLQLVDRGLQAVIVNPGFMFGPWDWKPSSGRMILAVAKFFTPIAPRGGCSVCDARDVASGIIAAAQQGTVGRKYILAGTNISYFRLWKLISKLTKGSPVLVPAGPINRWMGSVWGDCWLKLRGIEPDLNSASVQMSTLVNFYSSSRAQSELGYSNRPLEETIRDAWEWFQTHGYDRLSKFMRL